MSDDDNMPYADCGMYPECNGGAGCEYCERNENE